MNIGSLFQTGMNLFGGLLGGNGGLGGLGGPAPGGNGRTPSFDGGWDASIRGASPKGVDRAMVDIAGAVYNPSITHAGGWSRVGDGELARAGIDPGLQYRDGLKAGVFTDGRGHYIVGFAGNDGSPQDIPTVIAHGAGVDTHQAANAVQLAHQVERAYGGDNVAFTGHSMGGGLAGIAAAATGSTSVVFNAQGVHDNALARLGLDPAATRDAMASRSRAYGMDGDYATHIQNDVPFLNALPDALGADLRLNNPEGLSNLVNAHNLGPIAQAMDRGFPVRSGHAHPQVLEGPLQVAFNGLTSLLQHLPFRV